MTKKLYSKKEKDKLFNMYLEEIENVHNKYTYLNSIKTEPTFKARNRAKFISDILPILNKSRKNLGTYDYILFLSKLECYMEIKD